jgi:hypothetical protein
MNILRKIYNKLIGLFQHDCQLSKKIIGLETSTFAGKQKITKIRYKCQKCFIQWEEYKK